MEHEDALSVAMAGMLEIQQRRLDLEEGLAGLAKMHEQVVSALEGLRQQKDTAFTSECMQLASDESPASNEPSEVDDELGVSLPCGWPDTLKLHPQLEPGENRVGSMGITSSKSMIRETGSMGITSSRLGISASQATLSLHSHLDSPLVLKPYSRPKVILDFVSAGVLLYDLCVIPPMLAWDLELTGFLWWATGITTLFWTADMIIHFRTAIYVRGVLETSPKVIAREYLRTWFIPDLLVVMVDWLSTIVWYDGTSTFQGIRMLRCLRMGRILRLVEVLSSRRLKTASEQLDRLVEQHLPVSMDTVTGLLKLMVLVIWTNHVIACVWFAIGSTRADFVGSNDTGLSWLDITIGSGSALTYRDFDYYAYLSAFHWSVCQMTPGSNQIHALNSVERLFNIVCLLIGMVFFSSLVSSVSAKLNQVRVRREKLTELRKTLRRFLHQQHISAQVGDAAQKQLEERMRQQPRLLASDVPALKMISHQLNEKIFAEQFSPLVKRSALFRWWGEMDPSGFEMFCHHALESKVLPADDTLFRAGDAAHCAYTLVSGTMQYESVTHCAEQVGQGDWISEAALWTSWLHIGHAKASSACELVTIDAQKALVALKRTRLVHEVFSDYARVYRCRVISAKPPYSQWANDLHVPDASLVDILPDMPPHARQLVGLVAVSVLRFKRSGAGFRSRLLSQPAMDKLSEEVDSGKCTLMLDGEGDALRLINLVALRMESTDGKLFVQLGTWDAESHTVQPACQLPGTKKRPGESSLDAVNRILSNELSALVDRVTLGVVNEESESNISRSIGARTLYKKILHSATFAGTSGSSGLAPAKPRPRQSHIHGAPSGVSTPSPNGTLSGSNTRITGQESLFADGVHVVTEAGKTTLFAWLTPEKFQEFRRGDGSLQTHLNEIEIEVDDFFGL